MSHITFTHSDWEKICKAFNLTTNQVFDYLNNLNKAPPIPLKMDKKKAPSMDITMKEHVAYYKRSLQTACDTINEKKKTKALKDVIGAAFEEHRRRLWEYFGFTVDKQRHQASWNVDWSIYKNGKLIAFEEDKGHYVDSCFLEKALTGAARTINTCLENKESVPCIILHSFTTYSKFSQKLVEFCGILKPELVNTLKEKLIYTTLYTGDRLSTKKWFQSIADAYVYYEDDDLIKKDIIFIQSLM